MKSPKHFFVIFLFVWREVLCSFFETSSSNSTYLYFSRNSSNFEVSFARSSWIEFTVSNSSISSYLISFSNCFFICFWYWFSETVFELASYLEIVLKIKWIFVPYFPFHQAYLWNGQVVKCSNFLESTEEVISRAIVNNCFWAC